MSERVFIDTNVWVHAADKDAGKKRIKARDLIADLIAAGRVVVSTQIMQEFYAIAIGKLVLPADVVQRRVALMARLDVVVLRPELVLGAIDLHRLNQISFWDALVVRAASSAGCARVLSEDLSHGQVIEGVRIENPFAR